MSGFSNPSLTTTFEDLIPLTPDDTVFIEKAPAGLRITNPANVWATVAVICVLSDAVRIIDVPPASVLSEPLRIKKLMFTQTTSGLKIQGYYHA